MVPHWRREWLAAASILDDSSGRRKGGGLK